MKRENDELIQMFRTQLADAELPVRESLWDELEKDIPATISRRRILLSRLSVAASILLILSGASAAFWFLSPKDEIAEAFEQIVSTKQSEGIINNDYVVQEEFPPLHTYSQQSSASPTSKNSFLRSLVTPDDEDSISVSISMSFSFSTGKRQSNSFGENATYVGNGSRTEYHSDNSQVKEVIADEIKKNKGWSFSLLFSANPPAYAKSHNGLYMLTTGDNNLNIGNAGNQGTISRDDFETEKAYNHYIRISEISPDKQVTRLKHTMPISVGLTVRKQMTKRFSLESGLVYSYFSSDLTAGDDRNFYSQKQKLHYLGIPVKGNYNLYSGKSVDIYASAGGMIEKCISGDIESDYHENGLLAYESGHSARPEGVQLSAGIAAGIQYNINEKFSVYAEPGISYHFDNNSALKTIHSDRPLSANLLCGARITF